MISSNAQIEFEAGQTLVPMAQLTDSGDHKTFTSASKPWSRASGFAAVVRPNGIDTGGAVSPAASLTNDKVDVDALTCYLAGTLTSVAGSTDLSVARGADANTHRITSVTVTNAGAIAAVNGAAGTAFSETRGANGGPPYIPVGSIEVAQVRLTSVTAGAVTAAEIYDNNGQHRERWDYPANAIDYILGKVEFASELPLSHTGDTPKRIYAEVYTPVFEACAKALDFVPVEQTYSSTSQEYYGGAIGGATSAIGQGKFTVLLEDGHTDSLLSRKGENLLFRFKQDRNRSPYSLTQGLLGISRTYPKTQQVQASCTITAEQVTVDFTG